MNRTFLPPPGKLCTQDDHDFDGYYYAEHIAHCEDDVTEDVKNVVMKNYGIENTNTLHYDIVHYIPLALGGSNNINNLWPMKPAEASDRRTYEHDLYKQFRDGKITQLAAINAIKRWHRV